jgi:hypothetical protein
MSRLAPPGVNGAAQLEATRMQLLGANIVVGGRTINMDTGDMYLQHM